MIFLLLLFPLPLLPALVLCSVHFIRSFTSYVLSLNLNNFTRPRHHSSWKYKNHMHMYLHRAYTQKCVFSAHDGFDFSFLVSLWGQTKQSTFAYFSYKFFECCFCWAVADVQNEAKKKMFVNSWAGNKMQRQRSEYKYGHFAVMFQRFLPSIRKFPSATIVRKFSTKLSYCKLYTNRCS